MTAYYNEIDPYAAAWLRNLIAAGHIADGMTDPDNIPDVEDLAPEQERWAEYSRRKLEWLDANPGAWPMEVRDACARIAEELGL